MCIISTKNGNFICVLECTVVNLTTYRQFTNAAWDWIKKIKIALSLGYPSSCFYNKGRNMLL